MLSASDKKRVPVLHRLPATRIRLWFARAIYRLIHLFVREDKRRVRRQGINYQLDISEGIDLSLFLFGGFQQHITHGKQFHLAVDAVVFDIGANIGAMALRYAVIASKGRVYAFEPTDYAYERLLQNLSLNPDLRARVEPVQAFVSARSDQKQAPAAYSSWKINGTGNNRHPVHGGAMQSAESAVVLTIDEFCRERQIDRVDLIKIDTDGHELDVLLGGRETLARFRPHIIFEAGLYLMDENNVKFEDYYSYFKGLGYSLVNTTNGHPIELENYPNEIPLRSTTDILAIPRNKLIET